MSSAVGIRKQIIDIGAGIATQINWLNGDKKEKLYTKSVFGVLLWFIVKGGCNWVYL
jgi:hypothetical protein